MLHFLKTKCTLIRAPLQVVVELGVGGRELNTHLIPGRIQLFGHQRGQTGGRALAFVQVFGEHGHGAVRGNDDEGIEGPFGGFLRLGRAERQVRADHQTGGGASGGNQKAAARGLGDGFRNEDIHQINPP